MIPPLIDLLPYSCFHPRHPPLRMPQDTIFHKFVVPVVAEDVRAFWIRSYWMGATLSV